MRIMHPDLRMSRVCVCSCVGELVKAQKTSMYTYINLERSRTTFSTDPHENQFYIYKVHYVADEAFPISN